MRNHLPIELFGNATPPLNSTAVSSTNTYRSKRLDTLDGSRVGLHISWTGTPTGTLTLWSTNQADANTDGSADTGWVEETDITFPAQPAGSASGIMLHLFEVGARWVRLKYVNASGSGELRGTGVVKE